MSDDRPADEVPGLTPAGVVNHWCEHPGCSNWGAFGYARVRSAPVAWYCFDHRDHGEKLLGRSG